MSLRQLYAWAQTSVTSTIFVRLMRISLEAVYADNMQSENEMRNQATPTYFFRFILHFALLLAVFGLSACSTVLHTQVQREHEWPAQMPEKTYTLHAIEDDSAQALQLAQLKNMLQEQLQKIGFVAVQEQPHLLIQLRYAEHAQPVYWLDDVFFTPQHRFWGRGPWRGFGMPYRYHTMYSRFDVPRAAYFPHWYGYAGPHYYPGWWLRQASRRIFGITLQLYLSASVRYRAIVCLPSNRRFLQFQRQMRISPSRDQ